MMESRARRGAHAGYLLAAPLEIAAHLVLHLKPLRSHGTNRNHANRRGMGLNNSFAVGSRGSPDERLDPGKGPTRGGGLRLNAA